MKRLAFFSIAIGVCLWLALSLNPALSDDSTIGAGVYHTSDGIHIQSGGSIEYETVAYAVDTTLTAAQSGAVIIVSATNLTFTLPSTADGLQYTFVLANAAVDSVTTNKLSISPAAADKIMGNGFTSADNKDLLNSGNTDREGDAITIVGDGSVGWYITSLVGTWTKES